MQSFISISCCNLDFWHPGPRAPPPARRTTKKAGPDRVKVSEWQVRQISRGLIPWWINYCFNNIKCSYFARTIQTPKQRIFWEVGKVADILNHRCAVRHFQLHVLNVQLWFFLISTNYNLLRGNTKTVLGSAGNNKNCVEKFIWNRLIQWNPMGLKKGSLPSGYIALKISQILVFNIL